MRRMCNHTEMSDSRHRPRRSLVRSHRPRQHHVKIRNIAKALGIQEAVRGTWHAFRRGKASDMLSAGDPISTILQAGGWRSPAILRYLVMEELDHRVATNATVDASDSEG